MLLSMHETLCGGPEKDKGFVLVLGKLYSTLVMLFVESRRFVGSMEKGTHPSNAFCMFILHVFPPFETRYIGCKGPSVCHGRQS